MKPVYPLAILAALCAVGCQGKPEPKASQERVDPGMQLLRQNRDAMYALHAYQAVCFSDYGFDDPKSKSVKHVREVAWMSAEKPSHLRYDSWRVQTLPDGKDLGRPAGPPRFTFAWDGESAFVQLGNEYKRLDGSAPLSGSENLGVLRGIFAPKESTADRLDGMIAEGDKVEVTLDGAENVEGVDCDRVRIHVVANSRGHTQEALDVLCLGKADHLLRKRSMRVSFDGNFKETRDEAIRNIDLSPKFDASAFKYAPPPGAKEAAQPKPAGLLTNGSRAAEFTAVDLEKKPVQLSGLRGKIVVIDFWASWCGPCRRSMPHTSEVIQKLRKEGLPVVALAVDDAEDWRHFADWVTANKDQYPGLRFLFSDPKNGVSSNLYSVSGIPTQYVVDKKGVVAAGFQGYGGPTDDLEKAIRAAAEK